MSRVAAAATLALLSAVALDAHDFWLAARSEPGGTTTISGHVGEKFPTADTRTTPDRVDVWRLLGPAGELGGRDFFQDGESLATRVRLPRPGTYLGLMTILARDIEMTGTEFTDYLREEGLDMVIAERARLNQSALPARERYARYAKIVLHTGDGNAAHVTRPTDLKAELVPQTNPAGLKPGSPLAVQLLVEGKAVADALVTAVSRDTRHDARTNAEGRATFTIPTAGAWLIKTVYMARPVDAGAPPADWESYWVTLAFEI
jgi:Domain of unknown function (DUF4198)